MGLRASYRLTACALLCTETKKVMGHFLRSRWYTHVWSQYWYHVAQKWHDDESYNHRQLVNNSYHVDGRTLHTIAWPQFINNPSCKDARCKDVQRIVIFILIFRVSPDSGSLISSKNFAVVCYWPSLLSVYLWFRANSSFNIDVIKQLSSSCQAVVRQSWGSRQAVVRQSSNSRQAVIRFSLLSFIAQSKTKSRKTEKLLSFVDINFQIWIIIVLFFF